MSPPRDDYFNMDSAGANYFDWQFADVDYPSPQQEVRPQPKRCKIAPPVMPQAIQQPQPVVVEKMEKVDTSLHINEKISTTEMDMELHVDVSSDDTSAAELTSSSSSLSPSLSSCAPAKKHSSGTAHRRRGRKGKSVYRGVCVTREGKWRAVIYKERKQLYLGVYESEIDAAKAHDRAARAHFGEMAMANFVETDEPETELQYAPTSHIARRESRPTKRPAKVAAPSSFSLSSTVPPQQYVPSHPMYNIYPQMPMVAGTYSQHQQPMMMAQHQQPMMMGGLFAPNCQPNLNFSFPDEAYDQLGLLPYDVDDLGVEQNFPDFGFCLDT